MHGFKVERKSKPHLVEKKSKPHPYRDAPDIKRQIHRNMEDWDNCPERRQRRQNASDDQTQGWWKLLLTLVTPGWNMKGVEALLILLLSSDLDSNVPPISASHARLKEDIKTNTFAWRENPVSTNTLAWTKDQISIEHARLKKRPKRYTKWKSPSWRKIRLDNEDPLWRNGAMYRNTKSMADATREVR